MLSKSELIEKNREEVNVVFSNVVGYSYQAVLRNRFPLAQLDFKPVDKLPCLGEGQAWVCDCGCGEQNPILIPYATMMVVGVDGLQAADIEGIWVSPCTLKGSEPEDGMRHFGMDLWDYGLDDLADPHVRLEGN